MQNCPLCQPQGEDVLWQDDFCRVILAGDAHYPAFCRVILNRHEREMTDLPPLDRQRMMITVMKVETVLRNLLNPDKINLASFGNMVPHVHWHIIPRWQDDRHFPEPTWGAVQRDGTAHPVDRASLQAQLSAALESAS